MAHNDIYDLIERTGNIDEKEEKERMLGEIYGLVDEYNKFIKMMDKKLDKVVIKMETFTDDGY